MSTFDLPSLPRSTSTREGHQKYRSLVPYAFQDRLKRMINREGQNRLLCIIRSLGPSADLRGMPGGFALTKIWVQSVVVLDPCQSMDFPTRVPRENIHERNKATTGASPPGPFGNTPRVSLSDQSYQGGSESTLWMYPSSH